MQASTSRAGLQQVAASLSASVRPLPPCICGTLARRLPSFRATSSSTAHETDASSISPRKRHFSSGRQDTTHATTPPRLKGRSQAEKLAALDEKTTILVEGLCDWVTPNDIRQLVARRTGHALNIKDVVMLPTADLRPAGRALVDFTHSVHARNAVEKLRGKTSPGVASDIIDCRLVDTSRKPIPQLISHRIPLSLHPRSYDYASTTRPNLRLGLVHSGRAVMLSGFPNTITPLSILERLDREDFRLVKGPLLSFYASDAMDDIVRTVSRYAAREEKFFTYLVRLPSIAEAHRLVASWNATWPRWGMMNGDARISAEIVW